MSVVPAIDWGRTAAITTVGLVVWRAVAWVLGLGWGRYIRDAMRPEFAAVRKEVRRQRLLTARRFTKMEIEQGARFTAIEDRLTRLEVHVEKRADHRG